MFKSSSLGSLVLLTAALCNGVSAQVHGFSISSGLTPSRCLRAFGFNGAAVTTHDCNTSTSRWIITPAGHGNQIQLTNQGTPFCLQAAGPASGSGVVMQDCNTAAPGQQWFYASDGTLRLAHASNLCLDVPNSNTANGIPVQVFTCHGGPNQVWRFN